VTLLLVSAGGSLKLPHIDYLSILPELILLGGAVLMILVSSLARERMSPVGSTGWSVTVALASLVASLVQWYEVGAHGPKVTVAGAVAFDGFSVLVNVLVSAAAVVALLVSHGWLDREGQRGPEMQVLMLVSATGATLMGAANDLIVVFLGLEILSIALYVLAAFDQRREASGEAALKYFILGAFSSAVFVYGIALVYGATGTSNIPEIASFLARNVLLHQGLLLAGVALLLVGFCFKIAAVPFHMWTPDVYQGSPSPITGFMAAVAKVGGFAALLRVFVSSFGLLRADWQPAIWVIAAITLLFGAVVALVQRDIKRMLAYSSINHAGFVLLGLQAATARGVSASLYYLFVYSFMVLGSFAVVTVVGGRGDQAHDLGAYRGLGRRHPWLAASFTVLLLSQAGIPFTTGFLAKLAVVEASSAAHSVPLAAIAMVSAVVAAFFYLGVVRLMWSPPASETSPVAGATATASEVAAAGPGATLGGPGEEPRAAMALAGVPSGAGPFASSGEAMSAERAPLAEVGAHLEERPASGAEAAEEAGQEARDQAVQEIAVPPSAAGAIAISVAVTLFFGVVPAPLLDFAHKATLLIH